MDAIIGTITDISRFIFIGIVLYTLFRLVDNAMAEYAFAGRPSVVVPAGIWLSYHHQSASGGDAGPSVWPEMGKQLGIGGQMRCGHPGEKKSASAMGYYT